MPLTKNWLKIFLRCIIVTVKNINKINILAQLPKIDFVVIKVRWILMKDYKGMKKELVEYVKNTSSDSIDLERFLYFQNYGLILDFNSLSNDFFRWNPRMITNTIFAMLAIKSKFETDRPCKKRRWIIV